MSGSLTGSLHSCMNVNGSLVKIGGSGLTPDCNSSVADSSKSQQENTDYNKSDNAENFNQQINIGVCKIPHDTLHEVCSENSDNGSC